MTSKLRSGTQGRALIATAVGFSLYAGTFVPAYLAVGPVAPALAVVPTVVAGWSLGARGGAAAAILSLIITRALVLLIGEEPASLEGAALGTLALAAVGALVGWMHELIARLRRDIALHQELLVDRHAALDKVVAAEGRLRSLLAGNPAVIYSTDNDGRLTFVSDNVSDLLGLAPSAVLADPESLRSRVHPDDVSALVAQRAAVALEGRAQSEFRMQRTTGEWIWVRDDMRVATDATGRRQEAVGHLVDITERKQAQQSAEHAAMTDRVTGMPNQVFLERRMRELLDQPDGSAALVLLDIDAVDEVVEAFGSAAGDGLTRAIGDRLYAAAGPEHLVAHVGKAKFAAFYARPNFSAAQTATALLDAFDKPFLVESREVTLAASAGVASAPEHDGTADGLFRAAEIALYDAKRGRERVRIYSADSDRLVRSQLELAGDLRHAIERGELVLHFQPIVDLRGRTVTHAEALVRWAHPTRGLVPPAEFIPIAERTGLMRHITAWVIDEALRRCCAWQMAGIEIGVAANLSARDLSDRELPGEIAAALARHCVAPSNLTLEITESMVMIDPERALETLTRLRAMGIRLAIDDFGTGYSSLAYLNRLPVDTIKVDRSFVKDLATDESAAAIVRATVDLAHTLGFGVVAEGAEDEGSLALLEMYGCDSVQGFVIARPLADADFVEWMRPSAGAVAARLASAARPAAPRVLVVDDQDVVRLTAHLLLARHGYDVLLASSAAEAIDLFSDATRPIDVVLTDVVMPGIDGKELVAQLALLRPHVPLIFMSGHPSATLDLPAGIPFIAKPFTEQSLVRALQKALVASSAHRRHELN